MDFSTFLTGGVSYWLGKSNSEANCHTHYQDQVDRIRREYEHAHYKMLMEVQVTMSNIKMEIREAIQKAELKQLKEKEKEINVVQKGIASQMK